MRKPITLLSLAAVVTLSVAASVNEPFKIQKSATSVTILGHSLNNDTRDQALSKGNILQDNTTTTGVSYKSPNFFKFGWSENNAYLVGGTILLGPCYTDLTWTNTSTNATSVKWTYDTTDLNKVVENTDDKLVLNYKYSDKTNAPKITATMSNGKDSTYYYGNTIYFGGDTKFTDPTTKKDEVFGACTYDLNHSKNDVNSSLIGYPCSDQWLNSTSYKSVNISAFGNVFPRPAASYTLSRCWVRYFANASAGVTFTMCIYKINEDGSISDDTLAIGKTTLDSDINSTDNDNKIYTSSFNMKYKDASLGTGDITIDTPVYLELSGFDNSKVTLFQPIFRSGVYDKSVCHAIMKMAYVKDDGATGIKYRYTTDASFGSAEPYMYCTDFEFQANVAFSTTSTGVNEISTSTTAPKVTVSNGNFVISASDAINEVSIYNASGVMEAKASLHGETTVDAQSLPHGIFVLRFSNGATAKIEK